MLNNKANIVTIVLAICLISVSLFAYSQIATLQKAASDEHATNNLLTDEIEDLNTQISTLESQIAELQNDVATLEGQVAAANAEKADLQSQIATLETQIDALNSQAEDLQSQIDALNAENLLLKEQLLEISLGWVEKARYDRQMWQVFSMGPA
ncbi:MAG: hypothetical protein QXJ02_04410, partial [Candidatus Bathyarchaeia archaeon]